jgi:hypothetical protein
MHSRRDFLWILVLAYCPLFPGCGGESPAQIVPQTENTTQPIIFVNDHTAGLEIARKERKPALIFFSVPDSTGSQRMLETTFCDDEIRQLAEWLVCIHVDGSRESALCESLEISSFPTTILTNTSGTEVRRLVGRQTTEQLAVQIHILLQVMAQRLQSAVLR